MIQTPNILAPPTPVKRTRTWLKKHKNDSKAVQAAQDELPIDLTVGAGIPAELMPIIPVISRETADCTPVAIVEKSDLIVDCPTWNVVESKKKKRMRNKVDNKTLPASTASVEVATNIDVSMPPIVIDERHSKKTKVENKKKTPPVSSAPVEVAINEVSKPQVNLSASGIKKKANLRKPVESKNPDKKKPKGKVLQKELVVPKEPPEVRCCVRLVVEPKIDVSRGADSNPAPKTIDPLATIEPLPLVAPLKQQKINRKPSTCVMRYKIRVHPEVVTAAGEMFALLRPSKFIIDPTASAYVGREHAVDNFIIRPYARLEALSKLDDALSSICDHRPRVADLWGSVVTEEVAHEVLPKVDWVMHYSQETAKDYQRVSNSRLSLNNVTPSKITEPVISRVNCDISKYLNNEHFDAVLVQDVQQSCTSRETIQEWVRRGLIVVVIYHSMTGYAGKSGFDGWYIKDGDHWTNYSHRGRDDLGYLDRQSYEWIRESDANSTMVWNNVHVVANVFVAIFSKNHANVPTKLNVVPIEVEEKEFYLVNRSYFERWFRPEYSYRSQISYLGHTNIKLLVHRPTVIKIVSGMSHRTATERVMRDYVREVNSEFSKIPWINEMARLYPKEWYRLIEGTAIEAESSSNTILYTVVSGAQPGNEMRGLSVNWMRNSLVVNGWFDGMSKYYCYIPAFLLFILILSYRHTLIMLSKIIMGIISFLSMVAISIGKNRDVVGFDILLVVTFVYILERIYRTYIYRHVDLGLIGRYIRVKLTGGNQEDAMLLNGSRESLIAAVTRQEALPPAADLNILDLGIQICPRYDGVILPIEIQDREPLINDSDIIIEGDCAEIKDGKLIVKVFEDENMNKITLMGPAYINANCPNGHTSWQFLVNDAVKAVPRVDMPYPDEMMHALFPDVDATEDLSYDDMIEWAAKSTKKVLYTKTINQTRSWSAEQFEAANKRVAMQPKTNESLLKITPKVRSISAPPVEVVCQVGPYVDKVNDKFKKRFSSLEVQQVRCTDPEYTFIPQYGGAFDVDKPHDLALADAMMLMDEQARKTIYSIVSGDDGVMSLNVDVIIKGKKGGQVVYMESDMTDFDRTVGIDPLEMSYEVMMKWGMPERITKMLLQTCSNIVVIQDKKGRGIKINQSRTHRRRSGTSDTSLGNSIIRLAYDYWFACNYTLSLEGKNFPCREEFIEHLKDSYKLFMIQRGFKAKCLIRKSIHHCTFLKGQVLMTSGEHPYRWIPSFAKIVRIGVIRSNLLVMNEGSYAGIKGPDALIRKSRIRMSENLNAYRNYTNMPLFSGMCLAYPRINDRIVNDSYYAVRAEEPVVVIDWSPMFDVHDLDCDQVSLLNEELRYHRPGLFIDSPVFRHLSDVYGYKDEDYQSEIT